MKDRYPMNPVDRLRRIFEEYGVNLDTTTPPEKREFKGVLSDREEVERAFGDVLHYESHGGWGE